MTRTQKIKCAADFGMTALLPLLMAYSLVEEAAHEWLGMAMLALLLAHHILNRSWLKHLPQGRYSVFRILQTGTVLLILLAMLGTMVSGIAMSRYVLDTPWRQPSWAQSLHLCAAYWGFVLMSLHLGLHGAMFLGIFRRISGVSLSPARTVVLLCIAGAVSALGLAAFIRNRLTDYLFLRTHFVMLDFDVTLTGFLADYLCIMVLFVCTGYYLGKIV